MRPNIRLSAVITALLLASAPAGALVQSATTSSASSAGTTAAASAEAVTASVASASIADAASASTTVAAAEAIATDAVAADQSADSSAAANPVQDKDQAGSTELTDVERRCGDEASAQYEPPSGEGQPSCYDAEGVFQPDNTYPAKYFSNELTCGTENELAPQSTPLLTISGDGTGGPGGGGGFLQVCSDDELPVHGRITIAGDVTTGGSGQGSLTADGDNTNSPDQAKGWAQVNFGSGGTPSVRCGKAHSEGGRADASNPTDEDTQEQCG